MILIGAIFSVILDLLQFAPLIGIAVAVFSYGYFGAFYRGDRRETIPEAVVAVVWPTIAPEHFE